MKAGTGSRWIGVAAMAGTLVMLGWGVWKFVLHGHLSPLDGIGPEQIGAREFEALLDSGEVHEVILATNPTVEGEATAHFLGERAAQRSIRASRIAHGIPIGGELEYVDGGTLAHALAGRISV